LPPKPPNVGAEVLAAPNPENRLPPVLAAAVGAPKEKPLGAAVGLAPNPARNNSYY